MEEFYARYKVVAKRGWSGVDTVTKCQSLINQVKVDMLSCSTASDAELVIESTLVAFSEETRQLLEREKEYARERSALTIQKWWRGLTCHMQVVLRTLSKNGLHKVRCLPKYKFKICILPKYICHSGPATTTTSKKRLHCLSEPENDISTSKNRVRECS